MVWPSRVDLAGVERWPLVAAPLAVPALSEAVVNQRAAGRVGDIECGKLHRGSVVALTSVALMMMKLVNPSAGTIAAMVRVLQLSMAAGAGGLTAARQFVDRAGLDAFGNADGRRVTFAAGRIIARPDRPETCRAVEHSAVTLNCCAGVEVGSLGWNAR